MPLYDYQCERCGGQAQEMRRVDDRHDAPECFACKVKMVLILSPTAGVVRNPAVPRRSK